MNAAVWYEFRRRHGQYNRRHRTHEQSLMHLLSHATDITESERKHIMKTITLLLAQLTFLLMKTSSKFENLNMDQQYVISQEAATIWFAFLDAKVYQNHEPWMLETSLDLFRDIFLSKLDIGVLIASYQQKYPYDTITYRTPYFFGIERDIKALLEHARQCVAELFIDRRGMYFGTLTGCPFFTVLPGACISEPPWDDAVEQAESFVARGLRNE
jgi:hypothetical protein